MSGWNTVVNATDGYSQGSGLKQSQEQHSSQKDEFGQQLGQLKIENQRLQTTIMILNQKLKS